MQRCHHRRSSQQSSNERTPKHSRLRREGQCRENNTVINVNSHIQFEITKCKRDFMGTTPAEYLAAGKCNDTNWNIPPMFCVCVHLLCAYASAWNARGRAPQRSNVSLANKFSQLIYFERISPKIYWLMPFCICNALPCSLSAIFVVSAVPRHSLSLFVFSLLLHYAPNPLYGQTIGK